MAQAVKAAIKYVIKPVKATIGTHIHQHMAMIMQICESSTNTTSNK